MNPEDNNIDQRWEYLSTYTRPYTMDLVQQYARVCAIAVNVNIVAFHLDTNMLNKHIELVLIAVREATEKVNVLTPRHYLRTGLATGPDDIQEFMNISEEYVILQHKLLSMMEHVDYITKSTDVAYAAAKAAQNNGTH